MAKEQVPDFKSAPRLEQADDPGPSRAAALAADAGRWRIVQLNRSRYTSMSHQRLARLAPNGSAYRQNAAQINTLNSLHNSLSQCRLGYSAI
jgi:hypothetical protein